MKEFTVIYKSLKVELQRQDDGSLLRNVVESRDGRMVRKAKSSREVVDEIRKAESGREVNIESVSEREL